MSSGRPVHILLADDHAMVRTGLRRILEAEPDLTVVAEAGDGVEALAMAREAVRLDLAVLDVSMPRMSGLHALREMALVRPDLRVLMLSMHDDDRYVWEALRAGAAGYVAKTALDRDLIEACRAVMRDESFVSARAPAPLVAGATAHDPVRDPAVLTPREEEVVTLIAEAHTSRQIAEILAISVKTVESHRDNVLGKLGMRDRVELTRYAIRRGLVAP